MTDIVVYSQAWSGDHPSEEGEEANGLLHGRVVLDGKEIPGIFEVRLICKGGDFAQVEMFAGVSSFRVVPLDQDDWDREDLSDFKED